MDNTNLQKNIQDFYQILPKEGQEYFSSMNWLKSIGNIAEKYNLAVDEIEGIVAETTLVLLGIAEIDNYEEELIVSLRQEDDFIEKEIIDSIYKEVVEPIGIEKIRSFYAGDSLKSDNNKKRPYKEKSSIFDARFNDLPKRTQEAISLSGWQESLLEIAKENKLNIEQSGILEDITIKTMRNEISHNDFSSKISSAIGLDSDIASKIESSVAEKIFDEIRNITRELEEETSDSPSGVPLPPYAKEEKIKNDENYFDEPPIPPYVNKNTLEVEKETGENKEESLKISIKEVLSDKTMTSNMGGIQSQDFSIPKTQINSVSKDVNQETLDSSPKTNHDPYREII